MIESLRIMKKHTLVVTLIAATVLDGAFADPAPTEAGGGTGGKCKYSSWNPELYSFYGAKDAIVRKLANIPRKLSERRVFLQVTQGDSSADVKLYEQQENGTFTVTEWTTNQTSRLLTDI